MEKRIEETGMRVLIAGASGMIGSFLAPFLSGEGYEVSRLVRHEPGSNDISWEPDEGTIDTSGLEGFDAVINLATMPWPARWTPEAKNTIRANRLATNGLLAVNLAKCQRKPSLLVCSSGMGIYPSSGDQELTEDSPLGTNFLASLQRDGEATAMQASSVGIRVVNLRTPAVVGGQAVRRAFGRIGNGQQWTSWVGRDELINVIKFILENTSVSGPVNPCSPNPILNIDYVATASRVLGTKPGMPIPAFIIRLMLGEMADSLMLSSRRMIPQKLLNAGYQFRFPELESALRHELEVVEV